MPWPPSPAGKPPDGLTVEIAVQVGVREGRLGAEGDYGEAPYSRLPSQSRRSRKHSWLISCPISYSM